MITKLSTMELLNEAWIFFRKEPLLAMGIALLQIITVLLVQRLPYFSLFLYAPISVSFFRIYEGFKSSGNFHFDDFFWGFASFKRFVYINLISLICLGLIAVGMIMLVIPGIYFAVKLQFLMAALSRRDWENQDFFDALKFSWGITSQMGWWRSFFFSLFLGFLMALGALFMGVGLLAALPLVCLSMLLVLDHFDGSKAESRIQVFRS